MSRGHFWAWALVTLAVFFWGLVVVAIHAPLLATIIVLVVVYGLILMFEDAGL